MRQISNTGAQRVIGGSAGIIGLIVASLILSFYAIVAGWMMAFCLSSLLTLFGGDSAATWVTSFGFTRNILGMLLFMGLTVAIIARGVHDGIERWSERLMPAGPSRRCSKY